MYGIFTIRRMVIYIRSPTNTSSGTTNDVRRTRVVEIKIFRPSPGREARTIFV